jgi:transformation/transcription domain-associated protein
MLHPSNFRSVMSPKLEFLVDQLASDRHTQLLSIPTNIMMATNLSPSMADLLMAFLNARLPKLADVSNPTSHVMVQLYRLLFMSLTKVAENHNVLRHYIADFLSTCLRLTCEVRHPNHYFTLLRHLFRCIGSSKLEVLHKEIIPMLPELYQGLMRLHIRGPPSLRDSCLEICLSTPARLPTLLTFVPLLMNAIVAALQSNDESVIKLGLRTLDFWIDNFNPEYISPIMQPHLNTLMRILSSFLAPSSSSLGNLALQVCFVLQILTFFFSGFLNFQHANGVAGAWQARWSQSTISAAAGQLDRSSVCR